MPQTTLEDLLVRVEKYIYIEDKGGNIKKSKK